jgi:transposase
MARYKPVFRGMKLIPLSLEDQIQPGTFEFALNYLVDEELDFSALDAKFKNDETGASAYDPRIIFKIVLLAYSRGVISSRSIEAACSQNVMFMAISGDVQPSYTHIAKFVRELKGDIEALFTQVLLTCDRMGLIGKEHFAIDGVKLPSNASKERSGTHAELLHRADRLEKAAAKIMQSNVDTDEAESQTKGELKVEVKGAGHLSAKRQAQADWLHREAKVTREFVANNKPRTNAKGQELKSNVTDNESAKIGGANGAIQGYAAQAAVDDKHQIIVAAEVLGSGSEQAALLPMVARAKPMGSEQTIFTADAGYHSADNLAALYANQTPAMIADNQMRNRDERLAGQDKHRVKPEVVFNKKQAKKDRDNPKSALFGPEDFYYDEEGGVAICPAGHFLISRGSDLPVNKGYTGHRFAGAIHICGPCSLRDQCLRHPNKTEFRQVMFFQQNQPSPKKVLDVMRQAIDSPRGRALYSKRIGTVEPVFANIRHNKRMNRFTLRGQCKVNTQWNLYCLVHNIEKIANNRLS